MQWILISLSLSNGGRIARPAWEKVPCRYGGDPLEEEEVGGHGSGQGAAAPASCEALACFFPPSPLGRQAEDLAGSPKKLSEPLLESSP